MQPPPDGAAPKGYINDGSLSTGERGTTNHLGAQRTSSQAKLRDSLLEPESHKKKTHMETMRKG